MRSADSEIFGLWSSDEWVQNVFDGICIRHEYDSVVDRTRMAQELRARSPVKLDRSQQRQLLHFESRPSAHHSQAKAVETEGRPSYQPISSVWEGGDSALLEAMFDFYACIPPEPILDATYNAGRFWKGSERAVVSMDIDPKYNPMIVGDNRVMAGVPSAHFGVVVFDPPHVGPQGRDKSRKRFDVDFGATVDCGKDHDWNLSYLYPPFLKQARRVLRPNGLLLAKITDMVNNHKSKWPHCDFMRMAEEAGFTVCDLIVKIRTGPMVSTKWKNAHHARKRHCFWIVCRNGHECERSSSSWK